MESLQKTKKSDDDNNLRTEYFRHAQMLEILAEKAGHTILTPNEVATAQSCVKFFQQYVDCSSETVLDLSSREEKELEQLNDILVRHGIEPTAVIRTEYVEMKGTYTILRKEYFEMKDGVWVRTKSLDHD